MKKIAGTLPLEIWKDICDLVHGADEHISATADIRPHLDTLKALSELGGPRSRPAAGLAEVLSTPARSSPWLKSVKTSIMDQSPATQDKIWSHLDSCESRGQPEGFRGDQFHIGTKSIVNKQIMSSLLRCRHIESLDAAGDELRRDSSFLLSLYRQELITSHMLPDNLQECDAVVQAQKTRKSLDTMNTTEIASLQPTTENIEVVTAFLAARSRSRPFDWFELNRKNRLQWPSHDYVTRTISSLCPNFKNHPEFIKQAINFAPQSVQYLDPSILQNPEAIQRLVCNDFQTLEWLPTYLRADKKLLKNVTANSRGAQSQGALFAYFDSSLFDDVDFLLEIMRHLSSYSRRTLVSHLPERLQGNGDFLEAALKIDATIETRRLNKIKFTGYSTNPEHGDFDHSI